MSARRLRSIGSNVIAPVGIGLLLFAILEGGCRVVGRVRTGTWPVTAQERGTRMTREVGQAYRLHPFLSVAGRPGAVIRLEGHEARFSSLGTRGPEPVQPKPERRYRVVCEGGSTTFDLLARDDGSTWPAILGGLLGNDADVVNAGFPGWTTVESLVALALRDGDLTPDLVIVYAGVNDLQPAGHVPFARDYSLGHGEILPRVLGAIPAPLPFAARSVFVEWLRGHMGLASRGVGSHGYAPAWGWTGGVRRDSIPAEAVDVFARNLKSTVAVARTFGAKTLLVAQTARIRAAQQAFDEAYIESWSPGLTAGGYLEGLKRYGEAARSVASGEGAYFIDPFAEDAFTDQDFADPFHFSAAGSRKFALRLAGEIRGIREAGAAAAAANIR